MQPKKTLPCSDSWDMSSQAVKSSVTNCAWHLHYAIIHQHYSHQVSQVLLLSSDQALLWTNFHALFEFWETKSITSDNNKNNQNDKIGAKLGWGWFLFSTDCTSLQYISDSCTSDTSDHLHLISICFCCIICHKTCTCTVIGVMLIPLS